MNQTLLSESSTEQNQQSVAIRTYELDTGEYPVEEHQQKYVQLLCLLYLATRNHKIQIKRGFSIVPDGQVMTPEFERIIFKHLGLSYDDRDVYGEIIDVLAAGGSKSSTHLSPYLFSDNPPLSPFSKDQDSEMLKAKRTLIKFVESDHLPFAVLSASVRASIVGLASARIRGHVTNNIHIVAIKNEAMNVPVSFNGEKKQPLHVWGEKIDQTMPAFNQLFQFSLQNEYMGHLNRYAKRKSVPDAVRLEFEKFPIDMKCLNTYLRYQRAISRPDVCQFSYDESMEAPQFSGTYHKFKAIRKVNGGFEIDVVCDEKKYTILTGLSAKFLNPEVTYKQYLHITTTGRETHPYGWFMSYVENNKDRTPREGRIKTIRKLGEQVQLTLEVNIPPAHDWPSKLISEVRAYFNSAYSRTPNELTIERAAMIPEGFRIMGIDIGAYRAFAYSVHEISFLRKSHIATKLADGRTAYLHRVAYGRCGERTENYKQFEALIGKIYALRDELKERKGTVTEDERRQFHQKLNEIISEKRAIEKAFPTMLSTDEYKYLALEDRISWCRLSIATTMKSTEEATEIRQTQFKAQRQRRRYLRRDYNRKLLHEVCDTCLQYQTPIVVVENFEREPEESTKSKGHMRRLLQMKGFKKRIEAKLKEINVIVSDVNADYSSQTLEMKVWGYRKDENFYPYVDGKFLSPVDADENAAQNLAIKMFFRRTDLMSFWAKETAPNLVKISNRATEEDDEEDAKQSKKSNKLQRAAIEFHFDCDPKNVPAIMCHDKFVGKLHKVYRHPDKLDTVTTSKASHIMKEKFTESREVVAVTPKTTARAS